MFQTHFATMLRYRMHRELPRGSTQAYFNQVDLRRDRYVPVDPAGRWWLRRRFDVRGPTFLARIQTGEWSIEQTCDHICVERLRAVEEYEKVNGGSLPTDEIERTWLANLFVDNTECPYMQKGFITREALLSLAVEQLRVLSATPVQRLVAGHHITMEMALATKYDVVTALCVVPSLGHAIESGQLSFEEVNGLTASSHVFENEFIRQYIKQGKLDLRTALHLTDEQALAFYGPNAREALDQDKITVNQMLRFQREGRLQRVIHAMVG